MEGSIDFAYLLTLVSPGFDHQQANALKAQCDSLFQEHTSLTPLMIWEALKPILLKKNLPFHIYRAVFTHLFPDWPDTPDIAPAWCPHEKELTETPIARFMRKHKLKSVADCHAFSIHPDQRFWKAMLEELAIQFKKPPECILDSSEGPLQPNWLKGASLNIAESCFRGAPEDLAIIEEDAHGQLKTLSYHELNQLSNRVALGLKTLGYQPNDRIAIIMPMNGNAVAVYLGIIKMGGVVVSIADSFSSEEISKRLALSHTKAIFTQDVMRRHGKLIPLYPRIKSASDLPAILLPHNQTFALPVEPRDITWPDFLSTETDFESINRSPMDPIHILFSSGTTGTPKAIAWNHTTPIKIASDAYFHQGITAEDILCWPTSLGWMMGPWLIFAAFLHQAAIALYPDAPKTREFGRFIERARVTVLGVVPTLVAGWRESRCMEGLHFEGIKVFSSTGECSNAEDMFYLMWLGRDKPIIEYCGGTEIGGAYLSSTLIQPNYPSLFSTAAMGIRVAAINPQGELVSEGEVCLFPPALGLSIRLENSDHFKVYYEGMPALNGIPLRRHGDQIKTYANGYYSIQGRVDDAMNLGGIKVSAAEIERTLIGITGLKESAAIAVTPSGKNLSHLIIYAVIHSPTDKTTLMLEMQHRIKHHLNPLFKIHDIVIVDELPKTASNKIMRKELRASYQSNH